MDKKKITYFLYRKQRNSGDAKHVFEKVEAEIFKTHFRSPLFRCSFVQ